MDGVPHNSSNILMVMIISVSSMWIIGDDADNIKSR